MEMDMDIERQNKALSERGRSKTENNIYLAFATFPSYITQGLSGGSNCTNKQKIRVSCWPLQNY